MRLRGSKEGGERYIMGRNSPQSTAKQPKGLPLEGLATRSVLSRIGENCTDQTTANEGKEIGREDHRPLQ